MIDWKESFHYYKDLLKLEQTEITECLCHWYQEHRFYLDEVKK